ncbi:MAG: 1-acyl-sn-glycerol-3-phosphate acyltransferase [Actinomycetota bacterium]|nr:1-acyl-sn-glycerol-3-phosphate acyltransferase [Actinomycetota bacterium]
MGEATLDDRLVRAARAVLGEVPAAEAPLQLDSLATAELAFALEEAFAVRLPDDARFETLADASEHVARGVEAPDTPQIDDALGRLQWLGEAVAGRGLAVYHRLEVDGSRHVPAEGPAVLAMNHDSLLDIPLLVPAACRPVWFMAKVELFRGRFSTWLFHAMGGFPVRRGAFDVRAVRAALEVVRRGRVLAMYPEGTRAPYLQPFLPGAAWVALASGAPLVPVAISGTADAMPKGSRLPKRTRVVVRFGEPMRTGIESDPRTRMRRARETTVELRSRVERMLSA